MTDPRTRSVAGDSAGFLLIEVSIAMLILTTGLLGLVGVIALGVRHASGSSASLIAREKARDAVESVHTARDTGSLSWARVRNVSEGGVFLNEATSAGPDGLVNTSDDTAVEKLRTPGVDGLLGNADDVQTPLTEFTRQITIGDLVRDGTTTVNPSLREITVTIRYRVQNFWREYTLRTFVSSFS